MSTEDLLEKILDDWTNELSEGVQMRDRMRLEKPLLKLLEEVGNDHLELAAKKCDEIAGSIREYSIQSRKVAEILGHLIRELKTG